MPYFSFKEYKKPVRHDKASMNYQRKVLALFGFLLPLLAPLMGFIAYEKNGPEFWYSISATFYASSNIFMIGTLAIFAFFLWTYKGYDLGDSLTCKFSSIMAAGILVFPCRCMASGETTGVLNLPTGVSHIIHCIIAALLFGSFAVMIGFRFTKTDKFRVTKAKSRKNKIYYTCSMIIMVAMTCQTITSFLEIGWFTIINEAVMLWSFSFAWAVKAGVFKSLEKEDVPYV